MALCSKHLLWNWHLQHTVQVDPGSPDKISGWVGWEFQFPYQVEEDHQHRIQAASPFSSLEAIFGSPEVLAAGDTAKEGFAT